MKGLGGAGSIFLTLVTLIEAKRFPPELHDPPLVQGRAGDPCHGLILASV